MFGMFKRKSKSSLPPAAGATDSSAAVPPVLPPSTPPALPPILPKGPRKHHHTFTHEIIPDGFISEETRDGYFAFLTNSKAKETMQTLWNAIGVQFGREAVPGAKLDVSTFRHESCLCCFWEFPPTQFSGEAALGLIVAGPWASWPPKSFTGVSVRYFVMERGVGPSTSILEWSANGFIPRGPGPNLSAPMTTFADMVFDQVFGKKRPTAEIAAKRLLILKHVGTYAQAVPYGQQLHGLPDLKPEAKADLHSIFGGMFGATLRENNLWEDVSPIEKQFFDCPVAELTQQQIINASWRLEAIQVLMWALGMLSKLPPCDTRATPEIFKQIPSGTFAEIIASARLRDENEIDKARDLAESWHWRSRTRQLQEEGQPCPVNEVMKAAGLISFDAIVRMSAKLAVERGDLPTSIGDDYPVLGKAYRDLTEDEWSDVRSITMERHLTLNWLCGYAPGNSWDSTPTET